MKTMKYLLWGGLALTVLFAGTSAAKAALAAQNLTYAVKPRFAGLDTTGLKIDLDASFQNDTSGQVELRDTLIEVYHGDSLMGKVDLGGHTIRIRPKSTGKLSDPGQLGSPIRLHVPYAVIAEYAPQAVSAFLGFGPGLVLDIKVRTRVKIPWVPEVAVRMSEKYTLEKPA
jgi:hypothetical protein